MRLPPAQTTPALAAIGRPTRRDGATTREPAATLAWVDLLSIESLCPLTIWRLSVLDMVCLVLSSKMTIGYRITFPRTAPAPSAMQVDMSAPAQPDDVLANTVSLLYDAAVSPGLWPDALDALEPLFASCAAHFFLWDSVADLPTLSLPSANYRGQNEFRRRYGRIDPRRQAMMGYPPGYLFLCHEHIDEGFVRRSEFYNDFSIPVGRRWVMTTRLWEEADISAVFAVFRPPGTPPYSEADRARLGRLLPHLRRAFRIDQQLRTARAVAGRTNSLLDALSQAVLATDAAGRIRHTNRAAEALLAAGGALRRIQGRLTTVAPAEADALGAALRGAVEAPRRSSPARAASLIIHDRDGNRIGVTVMPLGRRVQLAELPEEPLALVTASPLNPPPADPEPLRAAFGFTRAEAELVAALAGGRRLAEIAATRGVGMPTVRTQLRAVYEKTGTSRQPELVRLIAGFPTATSGVAADETARGD
jgi:DNA-binding CsgD family transcriptional regulator